MNKLFLDPLHAYSLGEEQERMWEHYNYWKMITDQITLLHSHRAKPF